MCELRAFSTCLSELGRRGTGWQAAPSLSSSPRSRPALRHAAGDFLSLPDTCCVDVHHWLVKLVLSKSLGMATELESPAEGMGLELPWGKALWPSQPHYVDSRVFLLSPEWVLKGEPSLPPAKSPDDQGQPQELESELRGCL